jgi:Amidohydrolase family
LPVPGAGGFLHEPVPVLTGVVKQRQLIAGGGGGSFLLRSAIPFLEEGFVPDIISSDRHLGSSAPRYFMTDLPGVMSRFVNMGMSLESVVQCATWNPARAARHEELGNLSPAAPADIAVLNLEKGNFGFVDMYGARLRGTQKLVCELTVRDGKIVFDRNGISRPDWDTLPATEGYACGGASGQLPMRWPSMGPITNQSTKTHSMGSRANRTKAGV